MKNTPFTQHHIALGAKMAEFAGFNMPISYTGINDEHAAVRNNAGVFDVSHMGEFVLKGENALALHVCKERMGMILDRINKAE
jgi:aminomethyltransferase